MSKTRPEKSFIIFLIICSSLSPCVCRPILHKAWKTKINSLGVRSCVIWMLPVYKMLHVFAWNVFITEFWKLTDRKPGRSRCNFLQQKWPPSICIFKNLPGAPLKGKGGRGKGVGPTSKIRYKLSFIIVWNENGGSHITNGKSKLM